MLPYVLVAVASFVGGCFARHYASAAFLPLTADAKKIREQLNQFHAEVVAHLASMVNKSEIMIRHDAQVFINDITKL